MPVSSPVIYGLCSGKNLQSLTEGNSGNKDAKNPENPRH
jgi:hypothetical protein